ncbi:MAG: AraC family transcriptional regulator [Gammaproteobacteria bacterium]|nr:AraC family transcriptional regulator [Gammaproteobacteria bacterium]
MPGPRMPLIQLSLLEPFCSELSRRGVDTNDVLASVGLSKEMLDEPVAAVHAMIVHQFLENAAQAADDPFFAAKVGQKFDISGWPILQYAELNARSLGDYLSIFVDRANKVATSVSSYLNVSGTECIFGENRVFKPSIVPAQNDAFMLSLSVTILRRGLGSEFDPSRISIVVSDPDVLPPEFDIFRAFRGDRMGFKLKFPTAWLHTELQISSKTESRAHDGLSPPTDFRSAFREVLRIHLGSGRLSAQDASTLVSMSQDKLARRLASEGTSISSEIEATSMVYARNALSRSNRSVSHISAALGYSNPTSFARAFRRSVGLSPSAYRSRTKST